MLYHLHKNKWKQFKTSLLYLVLAILGALGLRIALKKPYISDEEPDKCPLPVSARWNKGIQAGQPEVHLWMGGNHTDVGSRAGQEEQESFIHGSIP